MITGIGTGPILPWPHQGSDGSKPLIGPPAGEQQRRAAERRHAAERHHERRHLEPGDRESLRSAAGEPDHDRREQRRRPSRSRAALADGEAVPAGRPWPRRRRPGPQKASSEPIDRSMPAVRITKVMPIASRPEIDTCRITLRRLMVERKRGSTMANSSHQHDQEDQRREPRDEAEEVDALVRRGVGGVLARSSAPHQVRSSAPRRRAARHHAPSGLSSSASARAISPVSGPRTWSRCGRSDGQHFRQFGRDHDDRDAVACAMSTSSLCTSALAADVDAARRLVDDQDLGPAAPASAPAPPSAGCRRTGWPIGWSGLAMRMPSSVRNSSTSASSRRPR